MTTYQCHFCDYIAATEHGYRTHFGKAHPDGSVFADGSILPSDCDHPLHQVDGFVGGMDVQGQDLTVTFDSVCGACGVLIHVTATIDGTEAITPVEVSDDMEARDE